VGAGQARPFVPLAALVVGLGAAPVYADEPSPPPDKSGFNLFNPTPDADLRALCTDRPTKSTASCTVDAGHWQVESDVYNVTFQTLDGVTTLTQLFTNPTFKLGLTNTLDVELNMAPYEQVSVHDSVRGVRTTAAGIGDLFLRAKANLIGDDGGALGVAIIPYVKAPTAAAGVGNGEVEGGVLVPIVLSLPANLSLTFDPEADILANASGPGRHLNLIGLASFSYPVTKTVTASAEIWGDENLDPTGATTQVSFDLGLAWIPAKAPSFQLDGGANLGLTRATPGAQLYVGVSKRF
jgi:hypothetical protein